MPRVRFIFGSHVRGSADEWSDIDLVVIAPELSSPRWITRFVNQFAELQASTNSRVEPIPCGENKWKTEQSRPILHIARREGVEIVA